MLDQTNETNVQHEASMDNGSYQYSVVDELAALLEAAALGKRFSVYLGIVHNCQHLLISTEGTN